MRKFLFLLSLITLVQVNADDFLVNFEKYAEKAMHDWETPGMSIAIAKDNEVIYSKGFGVRALGGSAKVDPHTLFQIGSLSKSFTSALLAMLVDEEKLHWNDRVVDITPSFLMYDPWVTREYQIVDTVSQRSGLEEYSLDNLAIIGYKKSEILHGLRYVKPVTSFRTKYAYQNTFFLVAADIMQAKTGKNWGELITERIFKPLKMTESSFDSKSYVYSQNASWLHYRDPFGKIQSIEKPFNLIEWTYEYAPAGGINSNIIDMAKYMIMQMNNGQYQGKQIISAANVKYLHTPQILSLQKETGNSFYCLGWVYSEYSPYPFIWHTGGTSGAGTILAFIPEEKIGIVILTNEVGTNLHVALMLQFFDMYFKKPNQDWSQKILENTLKQEKEFAEKLPVVANPHPALPLEMYAGTYHDEVYGDAQVAVEGDHLVVILGPNKVKGVLKHLDRDVFTLILPAIDENGQNQVAFLISEKGVPDTMVFEKFAKSGYGGFKRIGEK